jgi:hypothetical protein
MSTPREAEDAKVVKDLQALARHVDRQLPYGWGFVVLAFPFGAGGRMNYVSNANRADIVRAMYEFIEATKGKWGEHVLELDSRAEDEQLGRARQRIAELEGLLARATEAACNMRPGKSSGLRGTNERLSGRGVHGAVRGERAALEGK